MSKRVFISLLLVLGCASLHAQDYDRLVERNLWYASSNSAAIRQDSGAASQAELFGNYTGGGFHAYGDANSLFGVGASARGIKHEKSFSMKGAFSFSQQSGKDMFGSMLLNAGRYPVDVFEFTPGGKKLQTYAFDGAISIDLSDNWRIGAGMDFRSSNYAKFKDLRYVDYVLDMRITPSVIYHSDGWAVGANLLYVKDSENLNARVVGTAVSIYDAFLNKGLWYGVQQLWSSGGIHLKETGVSGFPISESGYGAGLQASFGSIFLDAELLITNGRAGEKQNIWFRFPAREFSVNAGWKHAGTSGLHIVKANASLRSMSNHETILEQVSEGGITTTIEHGSNVILQQRRGSAELSYSFTSAQYEMRAALIGWRRNELASVIYPHTCARETSNLGLSFGGAAIVGRFKLIADFNASAGWHNESERNVVEGSGISGAPFRQDELNRYALEFELSPRINPALAVQYEIMNGLSAAVNAGAICAFGLETIESPVRYSAGLGLIYKF